MRLHDQYKYWALWDYLAFLVIGESVLIFIPFITGIAQDATGYSNEMKTVNT